MSSITTSDPGPPAPQQGGGEGAQDAALEPFAWLSGPSTPALEAWLERQRALVNAYFDNSAAQRLRENLATMLKGARVFHARARGDAMFMLVDLPGKEQPALMVQSGQDAPRVVFEPGGRDPYDRLVQALVEPSPDGAYVAFAVTDARGPLDQIRVRGVDNGEAVDLPPTIVANVSWAPDGRSFYYNYNRAGFSPAPEEAREEGVYRHRMGDDPSEDVLVFKMRDEDAHCAVASASSDGRYLFVRLLKLVDQTCRLFALPLDADGAPCGDAVELAPAYAGFYGFVGDCDGLYVFETNRDAPMGRVVGFKANAQGALVERALIAPGEAPLALSPRASHAERNCILGAKLYLTYIAINQHDVRAHGLDGSLLETLALPRPCSVAGADGERCGRISPAPDGRLIVDLWRYQTPPHAFAYEPQSRALSPIAPWPARDRLEDVRFDTLRVRAKDGADIPVTLLYRGRPPLSGSRRPFLLYGYGGFGTAILPEFMEDAALFLALGGVFAVAHVRGGGEFGAAWREAARGRKRQAAFDDFIAVAENLIEQGIAHPKRLAAKGVSNGGLLVGAAMTQRPNLFGAVIAEAPLLDPLRIGDDAWSAKLTPEYGDPTHDAGDRRAIAAYAPLHNIGDGETYPPCLAIIGDSDAPLLLDGTRKFIARLQSLARGGPHLLHVLPGVGHTGWPQSVRREVAAREIAFLMKTLDADFDVRGLADLTS